MCTFFWLLKTHSFLLIPPMMHFFFISSSQRFLSNLVCVLSDDVFCNDDILNSSMYVQLTRSTAMQFVEIDTSYVHTMFGS